MGSSRIWVDIRGGEGSQIANLLRRLGFIVEEVVPLPDKTREPRKSTGKLLPEFVLLPAQSRFFECNHQSLESVECRPTSEAAAQLFQKMLQ